MTQLSDEAVDRRCRRLPLGVRLRLPVPRRRALPVRLMVGVLSVVMLCLSVEPATAQDGQAQGRQAVVEPGDIQALLAEEPADGSTAADQQSQPSGVDLLSLIVRGGGFMVPIGVMSLLVVTLAAERMISLRRRRVIPPGLAEDLEAQARPIDRFDPTEAFRSCLQYPSPAARVVKAMLLRTGQPLGEIERTATEAVQREADQQASPIRWLTLAAAATPLMGLLGTVWGMIVAFHESTTLTPDRSRSEQLSEGIYTALVTTLAGLVVAIPAAILALYLENRLTKLFHHLEELAFDIAPGLERFRGRRRLDAEGILHPLEGPSPPPTSAEAPQPPPPPPRPAQQRDGAKAG